MIWVGKFKTGQRCTKMEGMTIILIVLLSEIYAIFIYAIFSFIQVIVYFPVKLGSCTRTLVQK